MERPAGSAASSRPSRCVVLWLTLGVAACAPTAPEVRLLVPLPHGVDTPIYLTATRQRDEIVRALREAGFRVAERVDETPYYLRVTVGTTQGSKPCGTLNNVRYQLNANGHTVAVAEAKGWTGSCEPNIFDGVSLELRRRILAASVEEGSR